MKGYKTNPYMKYLPYAIKAAKYARPYMKTYKQRNQSLKRKSPGYARTSRRPYKKSKVTRNTKMIKKLQAHDRQSLGDMTYRQLGSSRVTFLTNDQGVVPIGGSRTIDLESILSKCKFFDPSNPATLIEGSLAAGTYQRNVRFENITSNIECRNNYGTTMEVTIYKCLVKEDTNNNPITAWASGIPDGSNLSTPNDLGQYPTDYDLVNDLWKLTVAKKVVLQPGQAVKAFHKTGAFEFASSTVDTHALAYQKEYKSFEWLVIAKGVHGHDTSFLQVANMPGGIDFSWTNVYKVKYDAGINIRFVHVDNGNADTFSNAGVMSQKPMTDNQGYSVA